LEFQLKDYTAERDLVVELNKKQSLIGMIVSTIIALIPSLAVSIFMIDEKLPIILWILPGAIMGGFIRLALTAHSSKLRLIPAITLFIVLAGALLALTFNPLVILLALTNAFVVLMVARPKFTKEGERALWLFRQGKFEL
jgi:hypothetical protein